MKLPALNIHRRRVSLEELPKRRPDGDSVRGVPGYTGPPRTSYVPQGEKQLEEPDKYKDISPMYYVRLIRFDL